MTTDEVIKYLEYADDFMRHNADWHDREAIDLAIEALKQQKTMPTIEQSMRNEFRLEVENSELRHQIEILKKQLDKYKENNQ